MPFEPAADPHSSAHAQRSQSSRRRRRWLFIGLTFLAVVAVGIAYVVRHSPFSRDKVKQSLEEDFHGQIAFQSFRSTYFPHPGRIAEGLTLVQPDAPQGSPPLVYVRKFTLRAPYASLLLKPGYISRIVLDGLRIQVPPKGPTSRTSGGSAQQGKTDQSPSKTRIGEVVANNAHFLKPFDALFKKEPKGRKSPS